MLICLPAVNYFTSIVNYCKVQINRIDILTQPKNSNIFCGALMTHRYYEFCCYLWTMMAFGSSFINARKNSFANKFLNNNSKLTKHIN